MAAKGFVSSHAIALLWRVLGRQHALSHMSPRYEEAMHLCQQREAVCGDGGRGRWVCGWQLCGSCREVGVLYGCGCGGRQKLLRQPARTCKNIIGPP